MYKEQAQQTATINPSVPQASPAAFGTGIAKETDQLGQNVQKIGTALVDHATQMQTLADNNTVIQKENEFRNLINNALYDSQNQQGLLQQAGHNAKGAVVNFDDLAQKTMNTFGQDMISPNMQKLFSDRVDSWLPSMRNAVAKHEAEQTTKSYQEDVNTNIQTSINTAMQTPGLGSFVNMSQALGKNVGDLQNYYGYSDATALQFLRDKASVAAVGMAKQLEQTGDVAGIENLANGVQDKINGDALTVIRGLVAPLKQNIKVNTTVNDLYNDPECRDSHGVFDITKAIAKYDAQHGQNATKIEHVYIPGSGVSNKEDFFNAVSGQESGGNYEAQNGRTGAFGKYQIMPGNWPSWSKQAGLPDGAEQTPENQEVVAKYKLGQYYDAYGAEGALVAWYAGEQNGKRWAEGAPNAIGEGGSYSWDAKQGNGDEPSVREYVQQSLSRAGSGTAGHYEDQTVSAYNPKEYDATIAQIKQKAAESDASYRKSLKDSMDNWSTYVLNNQGSLKDYNSIAQAAQQFGFTGTDLNGAIGVAMQQANILKVQDDRAAQNNFEAALGDIYNGKITNKQELDAAYGGTLPYTRLMTLQSALGSKGPKWASPENVAALNGVVKELGLTSIDKARIMEKLNLAAQSNKQDGQPDLSADDVVSIAREQGATITINKSGLLGGQKVNVSSVPAGWTITDYGVLDPNGNTMEYDNATGSWHIRGAN